ncbi:MAG TPA: MFS transporter, partial [Roseiarcus sp.]|nr:MFS transporter [Roseiarcus sp.]
MTPAARVAAAIEILSEIGAKRRPAADAMKDWGLNHRFAGAKDRSAIAGLVYDALRRKASSAWIMSEDSPRAVVIGAFKLARELSVDDIAELFSGQGHGPSLLSREE